jgi:hypothetical protein
MDDDWVLQWDGGEWADREAYDINDSTLYQATRSTFTKARQHERAFAKHSSVGFGSDTCR